MHVVEVSRKGCLDFKANDRADGLQLDISALGHAIGVVTVALIRTAVYPQF
jgi:hypothetical protein